MRVFGIILPWCLVCLLLGALLIVSLHPGSAPSTASSPLAIGLVPPDNPKQYVEGVNWLRDRLESCLGLPVQIFTTDGPEGLVQAIRTKRVQVAFINQVGYVKASQGGRCWMGLVVVRKGASHSRAGAFVRADSQIRALSDVKGRIAVFTYPMSTSGYSFPVDALVHERLVTDSLRDCFKRVLFIPQVNVGLKALLDGQTDVYFAFDRAVETFYPDMQGKWRIIWTSDPIPNDGVAFTEDLPTGLAERIKAAVCAIRKDEWEHVFPQGNIDRYIPTHDQEYMKVRDVHERVSEIAFE